MTSSRLPLLLLCSAGSFALGFVAAPPEKPAYVNVRHGFRMTPPQFDSAVDSNGMQDCIFMAPVKDGYSSNINVMIQPLKSVDDYEKATRDSLEPNGLELVKLERTKVGERPALAMEYTGRNDERDLTFIALAAFGDDRVVLVTCTAPQKDLPNLRAEFDATLKSFTWLAPDKTQNAK